MKISSKQNLLNYKQRTYPNFASKVSIFSKKLDKIIKSTNSTQDEDIKLLNLLKKIINKKTKEKSFLGEGRRGIVLLLDSKYVLKIDKNTPLKLDFMSIPFDKFNNLNFKSYFGGVIAKFGNVHILKNISKTGKHTPAGVPSHLTAKNHHKECIEYYEKKYLPKFSSLPQKTFDDVAYDFKLLNKNNDGGYCFDVRNPNNFVLVGKKIRIVDSICQSFENEMATADLLAPFLFFQDVANECTYSTNSLPHRRKLFKKIVLAGLNNDLPLMNGSNAFIFEEVLENLCKSKVNAQRFHSDIIILKEKFSNKKEFLAMTKRYLNSIFDTKNEDISKLLK